MFGVGADHALWHRGLIGGAWQAWESLGGQLVSPVEVIGRASALDIFAVGLDGSLQTRHWDGSQWGAWTSLGGSIFSKVSAVSWSPNRLDVFGVGRDSSLLHIALSG